MEVTKSISERFRLASTLSMMAVVFIHARIIHSRWGEFVDTTAGIAGKVSYYVQFLLSENVGRIAVPLFFLISGFWMAYHNDSTLATYSDKLKKRVRTVLVPYLLVSLLWMVVSIATGKLQINGVVDLLRVWLIDPVPFQFWFLQHLMMLLLLSWPILYVIRSMRYGSYLLLIAMLIYSFANQSTWGAFGDSLLYYTIGMCLAFAEIKYPSKGVVLALIAIYVGLLVAVVANGEISGWLVCLYKLQVLVGVSLILCWILYSSTEAKSRILTILGGNFFVYAFHEPLQSMIKSAVLPHIHSQIGVLGLYLLMPVFVIAICLAVYMLMNKFMPRVAQVLTGGR